MMLRRFLMPCTVWLMLVVPTAASSQAHPRINIYRFVLGVDVPESSALIALDRTPSRVVRGSAPKPIAATATRIFTDAASLTALAVDIVPYYLVGGGARDLTSYRSNSAGGRLARVGTKTQLGIGSVWDAAGGTAVSLGLRATFHDPHDPVLNSHLPESADSALRLHGRQLAADAEEQVTDRSVDLTSIFDHARRSMRARHGIQISGGWGVAARVGGGIVSGDSLGPARHVLWLSGQITLGPRLDLLGLAQVRAADGERGDTRFGTAVERKAGNADFRAELYYQTRSEQLNGGAAVEVRMLHRASVIGSVLTEGGTLPAENRQLRAYLSLRWFVAEDP